MATTVDELIVEIKADLKGVTRGLNNVKKQLNSADRSTQRLSGALRRLTPILAGLASAQTVKNVVAIGDEFERLNISLSTMFGGEAGGAAAFDRIKDFARETPFQLEDVTKAFISLKSQGIEPNEQVLAAFGDAASATLTPLESFNSLVRMLGRSTQGALGLEDLNQLADRGIPVFKILEERIGKTRLEVSEFGKTSEGAATIMRELSAGLEDSFGGLMQAQMDTFGVKFSNVQIAFKEFANEVFQSGLGQIFKDMADSTAEMVAGFAESMRVQREGGTIKPFIQELINEESFQEAKIQIRHQIEALADEIDKTVRIRAKIASATEGNFILDQFEKIGFSSTEAADENILQMGRTLANLQAILNDLPDTAIEIVSGDSGPTTEQVDALAAMKGLLEDTITPLEAINTLFDQLDEVIESGLGDFTTDQLVRLMNHLDELKADLEETSTTFKDVMAPAIASAAQSFTSDFVNSLMEGESALESFKNFAKDIVSQIITTFLQMAVVNNILNSVFGLTGDAALPTFPIGKAGGGNVSRGQPYLVGERGPELFMPNTGGRIMNNADTRNAGTGGDVVVNQTINLSAGVVGTVRSEVQRMLPEIANVAKVGVLEATRRGGTYRRGLLGS